MTETAAQPTFDVALRKAIRASGLSLDRIQYRLAVLGSPVSLATLSYWQRGRSRPERPESLRAVRILEHILGLPENSLVELLGPPRPRGRWVGRTEPMEMVEFFADRGTLATALSAAGIRPEPPLRRLSVHDDHVVGPDRMEKHTRVRQVVRAEIDGVDRCLAVYWLDDPRLELPVISRTRFCRPERVSRDRGTGFLIAELILPQRLSTGDTAVIEYELDLTGTRALANRYDRRFRRGAREYVLTVTFPPDAVPTGCHEYAQSTLDEPPRRLREVRLDEYHAAHLVALDIGPGIRGLAWDWPDQPGADPAPASAG